MSLCLTRKFTSHNSSVSRSYTYQKIWKTFSSSWFSFLVGFFFSCLNTIEPFRTQNSGCHIRTSSFADTFLLCPVPWTLPVRNQMPKSWCSGIVWGREIQPTAVYLLSSLHPLQGLSKSDIQKDPSAVCSLVRSFLWYFDCQIIFVTDFSLIALRKAIFRALLSQTEIVTPCLFYLISFLWFAFSPSASSPLPSSLFPFLP